MIETISNLQKWNGHLYNWYNTKTLEPLIPTYVSSVDSGNFVGYLYVTKQFLEEVKDKELQVDIQTMIKIIVKTILNAPISHLLMSSIDYRIIIYEKKQVQIVIPSGILFLDLQPVCLLADTLPLGLRTQRYISAQSTAH